MWRLSAIASVFVALVIHRGWPSISLIALGVLMGVSFISTGISQLFVSRALRPSA